MTNPHKPICVTLMEFSSLQCTGKVSDKVRDKVRDKFTTKSRTQITKVGDVICVADFRDLCPRQVRDFFGNLSLSLSQSQHNGIWALSHSSGFLLHFRLFHFLIFQVWCPFHLYVTVQTCKIVASVAALAAMTSQLNIKYTTYLGVAAVAG